MDPNVKVLVIAVLIITPFLLILRSRIRFLKRTEDARAGDKYDPIHISGYGKMKDGEDIDEEY